MKSEPSALARGLRLALLALLLAFCCSATATDPRFVPGQILVKPKAQLSEPDFAARLRVHAAWHRQTLHHSNVRVLNVSENRTEAVLAALRNDPGIEFAERDSIAQAAFVPNDPFLVSGQEWHLAKVQAPQAWNLTTGNASTVVAILDSGINAAHPDLAGRVLPGFSFVSADNSVSDDLGHGTAVAGVVIAAGNNGLGVAGVAYGCRVLPVKVLDSSGFAAYSSIAQGIKYAVDQGARVINISIAGNSPSSTLQEAINYAWDRNVVVVVAAGNNANTVLQYPAACDHVLAVAATEPDDSLASFSSYGSFVALSAPGDNIWTTQRDLSNPYGAWRGTSFASPLVAGAAALVASANAALSNTQIVALLEQTADDLGPPGYDISFGHGRVNVLRALSAANPEIVVLPPVSPMSPIVSLASPANGTLFNFGAAVPLTATAAAASGSVTSVVFIICGRVVGSCSTPPFTANWLPVQPGSFSVAAVARDEQGLCATSAPVMLNISEPKIIVPSAGMTALLKVQTNGLGRVSPNLNGRQLELGKPYRLRAVPGPGQVFAGWEGISSQSPVLTFVMQSNLNLVANFVPSPFLVARGSYAGLMANTNGVTPDSSAYFRLTVTAMGKFTGRLINGGHGYGFRGQLNLGGDAMVTLDRAQLSPLTVALHVDLTKGTDQVGGSVTDGSWTSELAADRNVFSSRWNPALQAGVRSFILEPADGTAKTAATSSSRISLSGTARLRGKLFDGRAFGAASALAKNGDCPFYLSLNRGTEVVIGWLNFPEWQGPTATGTLLWVNTGTNAFAAKLKAASAPE